MSELKSMRKKSVLIKVFLLFLQERKRLKERFPTLAMEVSDKDLCTVALNSYEQLLLNNDICEGNCVRGQSCPTGANAKYTFYLNLSQMNSLPPNSTHLHQFRKKKPPHESLISIIICIHLYSITNILDSIP